MQINYKTEPRQHQREWLEKHADDIAHAIHFEQGTGKTKLAIDNIAYLYQTSKIDGALIIAPPGIDLNWMLDEIPTHLPDDVRAVSRFMRFIGGSSGTKWHQAEVKFVREHHGLAWMFMTYDSFMTLNGKEAALKFLEKRKAFYLLDESTRIKTPAAKRTQRIVRTSHRAKYRRTMTGTPMPNGAFDIYKQIEFLDPTFWEKRGWPSIVEFRTHFGQYDEEAKVNRVRLPNGDVKIVEYKNLLGYRNLEQLNEILKEISSRVLKKDVLDLPPKIYQSRWFEMQPKQRELYNQMKDEFKIWLDEQTLVTANLAMVRMLRLQQISCGYLPTGIDEPVHMIPGSNPRLELLEEVIEDFNDKMIIWSRYRLDIDLISDMLRTKRSNKFVVYDGRTTSDELTRAKEEFQRGEAQFFISNPAKGAEGLTLHAAKATTYYSNSFNLNHRLQSEDRAHRDGLKHPANYIDLLGKGTIDPQILYNLCGKMETSSIVLGDGQGTDIRSQLSSWLDE